ncbi:MAG: hypothetical protein MK188_09965 [Gammaproteobacteria bacterium]|nr:hypothetical protein [Gammaproteobacteria bacterium]
MSSFNQQSIDQVSNNAEVLDALFSDVRSDEPGLIDQNITKVVLNTLPKKVIRTRKRSVLFDLVGLTLGLIAAYFFFDIEQIFVSSMSLIPESLSITVANIAAFFIGSIVLAFVAFWAGEKASK